MAGKYKNRRGGYRYMRDRGYIVGVGTRGEGATGLHRTEGIESTSVRAMCVKTWAERDGQ